MESRTCTLSCFKKSDKIKEIYCFPGNAGTAKIAQNISLDLKDFNDLKEFIFLKK